MPILKAALRLITILVLSLVTITQIKGQKATYNTGGGMIIGFGTGITYQGSDIKNSMGAGFDFVLGSHLYKRDNAMLAVDWKFRFVAGENSAFDHRENSDGSYSNIKYKFFDYDLELGVTLNRLREKSRIVITGFVGAGITHGRTFTDLLDGDGNIYDFSGIDPSKSRSEVRADLVSLSDNDFETVLSNKGALLPTAGIFIGYQFTRNFSMGLEHKTNFSLNEQNSTFGIDIDNNILAGSRLDRNHYTTLGFRWRFGGRTSQKTNRGSYHELEISPVTYDYIVESPPVTRTTKPVKRDSTGGRTGFRPVSATTSRPVSATVPVSTTRPVTTSVPVTTGQVLTSNPVNRTNPVTTARTNRTSHVETGEVKIALPQLIFLNPSSPATVTSNILALRIKTINIAEWQDINLFVNGHGNTNFSFTNDGVITLNIALISGENRIEVTGKNEAGVTREKTVITYQPVNTRIAEEEIIPVTNPVVVPVTDPVVVPVTDPVTNPVVVPVTDPVVVPVTDPVTNPVVVPVTDPADKTEITPCGVRINPGNAPWQFCLETPSGTFNRESLTNRQFTYSGQANSLFMMPIAGGGDAIVNGKAYRMKPGQYYLFTGSLTVSVSTKNPGSMGQWSICITAGREPVTGNGKNRPVSPCER